MTRGVKAGMALLGAFLVACLIAGAFADTPVIDDWLYAWSVQQMLATGHFRILSYSCHYNLLQVLWGALFSLPAGFSFIALRWSTVVLAAVALMTFYAMLQWRTGSTRLAAWTVALLAFNPVFFLLALSFMTDIPLLAIVFIDLGLLFWSFSGQRDRPVALIAALVLGVAAYLVRELGVALPVVILAICAWLMRHRVRRSTLLLLITIAALGLAAEAWWTESFEGASWGMVIREQGVGEILDVGLATYAWGMAHLLLTTAAFVAPLSLATLSRRDLGRVGAVAASVALVGFALGAVPFGANEVLSPLGLGMTRVLLPGLPAISSGGQLLRGLVYVAAVLSLGVLIVELAAHVRELWRSGSLPDLTWALFGAVELVLLMVLWLWQDRYYLILVPSVLWILAIRAAREGWRAPVLVGGCAVFALLGVLGTRENFALNQATWRAESWLRSRGVAASQIDAGYILNGWRFYAHPEKFSPGYPPDRVPFLFSKDVLPYVVSTTELPGADVVREFTWSRLWLSPPHIYVLRRTAAASGFGG